jgi:hypothetical protein
VPHLCLAVFWQCLELGDAAWVCEMLSVNEQRLFITLNLLYRLYIKTLFLYLKVYYVINRTEIYSLCNLFVNSKSVCVCTRARAHALTHMLYSASAWKPIMTLNRSSQQSSLLPCICQCFFCHNLDCFDYPCIRGCNVTHRSFVNNALYLPTGTNLRASWCQGSVGLGDWSITWQLPHEGQLL